MSLYPEPSPICPPERTTCLACGGKLTRFTTFCDRCDQEIDAVIQAELAKEERHDDAPEPDRAG